MRRSGISMASDQVEHWRGIGKLVEELGELQQLLGKAMVFPEAHHPDGLGTLRERLPKELADVKASIDYFERVNRLPILVDRIEDKLTKYEKWGLPGIVETFAKPYGDRK